MTILARSSPQQPATVTERPTGIIGPNAITRIAEALRANHDNRLCVSIFVEAGLAHHLTNPPDRMVDERDVSTLHRVLLARLGPDAAARVSLLAGRLTGDYLLARRIPALARTILSHLPRPLAARLLVRAIAKHAWTFSGSGSFSYAFNPVLQLRIKGSPICHDLATHDPACHYFAATFERVFSAMLGPRTRVREIECEANGAAACLFEVRWTAPFFRPA